MHQLGNIKTALDRQNQILKQSESKSQSETADTVYAQTLIQLDGKIINRYCEQIFNHPHQAQILELHHRSIKAGQQQWRLLLDFIIHFINPKN